MAQKMMCYKIEPAQVGLSLGMEIIAKKRVDTETFHWLMNNTNLHVVKQKLREEYHEHVLTLIANQAKAMMADVFFQKKEKSFESVFEIWQFLTVRLNSGNVPLFPLSIAVRCGQVIEPLADHDPMRRTFRYHADINLTYNTANNRVGYYLTEWKIMPNPLFTKPQSPAVPLTLSPSDNDSGLEEFLNSEQAPKLEPQPQKPIREEQEKEAEEEEEEFDEELEEELGEEEMDLMLPDKSPISKLKIPSAAQAALTKKQKAHLSQLSTMKKHGFICEDTSEAEAKAFLKAELEELRKEQETSLQRVRETCDYISSFCDDLKKMVEVIEKRFKGALKRGEGHCKKCPQHCIPKFAKLKLHGRGRPPKKVDEGPPHAQTQCRYNTAAAARAAHYKKN